MPQISLRIVSKWKNIIQWICRVTTSNNSYPKRLIPTNQDKFIAINYLIEPHLLGKWLEDDLNLKDPDGKLNAAVVDLKRLPGFSTNKIPESRRSDLNFKIKDEFKGIYNAAWVEGTNGLRPSKECFEINA